MNIKHHLDEATLLSYTAGSMTNSMALVVACHLSVCETCRAKAAQMEAIGGALLTELPSIQMSENALEKALAALDSDPQESAFREKPVNNENVPQPLAEYIDAPLGEIEWKRLGPGIGYIDLPTQGTGVSKLLRIDPGKSVLPHTHQGNELTMVLTGSFSDEVGRFSAGDVADLDDEIAHQPLVDSQEPCICLIATDAPLKFNSLLGRIIQPITGF